MKESYKEQPATDLGPDPYAGGGNTPGVASARGNAGQPSSSDIIPPACRSCPDMEKATPRKPLWQGFHGRGGVREPVHAWTFQAREPGDPSGLLHPMGPSPAAVKDGQQTSQRAPLS